MLRLIYPSTFPLHVKLVHSAVYFEPLHLGNSPIAARSCERMSLHLPGMRHALPAQHRRLEWHLPRHKLGRRQGLGYLEGGVSSSIPLPSAYIQGSYLLLLYLVLCFYWFSFSPLVAVGRPCRCLRRPPSLAFSLL
jgi:hypothetical protein